MVLCSVFIVLSYFVIRVANSNSNERRRDIKRGNYKMVQGNLIYFTTSIVCFCLSRIVAVHRCRAALPSEFICFDTATCCSKPVIVSRRASISCMYIDLNRTDFASDAVTSFLSRVILCTLLFQITDGCSGLSVLFPQFRQLLDYEMVQLLKGIIEPSHCAEFRPPRSSHQIADS